MSALPKPSLYSYPTPATKRYSKKRSSRYKTQVEQKQNLTDSRTLDRASEGETKESKTQTFSAQIAPFPSTPQLPEKLKLLILWQKSSLALAFTLIAASVAFYIANVRIPEMWSKKYEQLEILQRQERELTAANESLKHKLAQQAENKENNLTLVTSNNAIFIPPASISQPKLNKKQPETNLNEIPMGY